MFFAEGPKDFVFLILMIDIKLPLRKAYYQALTGQLTYGGNSVPVYDDITWLENDKNIYVLFGDDSGVDNNTQSYFSSNEDFQLQIVYTAKGRVSKEVLDVVADQVFALVLPSPMGNGLPSQPGVVIQNLHKTSDHYDSFKLSGGDSYIRRIVTFTQDVTETGNQFTPITPTGTLSIYYADEILTGVIDGVNKVFTTLRNYSPSTLGVTVNGLEQKPGLHYTQSLGNTITFTDAPQTAAQSGNDVDDILMATYISA